MENDILTIPSLVLAFLAGVIFIGVLFSAELINILYFKMFRKGKPYKRLFDSSDTDGECPL